MSQGNLTPDEIRRRKQLAARRRKAALKRKKQRQQRIMLVVAALLVVCAVAVVLILNHNGSTDTGNVSRANPTAEPSTGVNIFEQAGEQTAEPDPIDVGSVVVTDLSIKEGLDSNWYNVLLLGSDARSDNEQSRTDTMMICSVNKTTGEIKLASIMRDTAVSFEGYTNVRINSAFAYGGANLAMKVVNECFGMNISDYAYVNFEGFSKIAESLGGVDMDITEAEMVRINDSVKEQYYIYISQGKMTYEAAEAEYYATGELKTYGAGTHLNGMQALGYARIRKIDSDFSRAGRQQKVLNALLMQMKGADITTIMSAVIGNASYFKTNIELNTIISLAQLVLGNESLTGIKTYSLPVSGSYVNEIRGGQDMLFDVDFNKNTQSLYNFIYA